MIKKNLCFFVVFCGFLTTRAYADFYTCKDNSGHVVTSDRPIPECANRPTQIYQDNGILKNQLSAEPTPEQRRMAQLQEQQQAKEAARQEDIKREQRYLLTHYPNEDAIEVARKQAIDAIESKIATETRAIETATEALRKNQNAISLTPQDQPAKIRELQLKGDDLNQFIEESYRLIGNYRTEEVNINQRFDNTHKRYIEIILAK